MTRVELTRRPRKSVRGPEDRSRPILVVMGTRPEAIKLAPVVDSLRRLDAWPVVVVATSQHRDMLTQAMAAFNVHPDSDLDLMRPGQTPTQVAVAVMTGMDVLFRKLHPVAVIVQGDTTTALATAWGAFYSRIPVIHVEAGLRTRRLDSPFPEEFHRRGLAVVAALSFAPTESAKRNLLSEGVSESSIHVVGNTVVDAVRRILGPRPRNRNKVSNRLVLVTLHRRESFGGRLEDVLRCIRRIAVERPGAVRFVFPVHPNPNVAEPVRRILSGVSGVELVPPMDYPDFLRALANARFAMSDSGGVQEEAPTVGTPVLILRDTTERPEVLESGWGRLVGTDSRRILKDARKLLDDDDALAAMMKGSNPFGDGRAANRIAATLAGTFRS